MNYREKICLGLFEASKKPYAFLFKRKKKPWGLQSAQLLCFPEGSLGKKVGEFLKRNKFELIDKLESHDVYHVITGMSTSVKDEVGMQYLLLGNGKRTVYLFSTIIISTLLLPEYFKHFIHCFKKGKKYKSIHKIDLLTSLNDPLHDVRWRLQKNTTKRIKIFNHINDLF